MDTAVGGVAGDEIVGVFGQETVARFAGFGRFICGAMALLPHGASMIEELVEDLELLGVV